MVNQQEPEPDLPPEDLEILREEQEAIRKATEGNVLAIERTRWDPNDPLYTDRDRYLNMQYWLRQSQTLARMLFDYGFMNLSNVGIGIKNIRRLVQVYPPEFFIKDLPWDRRYLEVVGPSGAPDLLLSEQLAGLDGRRPFEIFGRHNQKTDVANGKTDGELKLPEGSLPSVITDAGQVLGFVPQDWWVFCGVKSEVSARKPTGLLQMPYDKVKEAVWERLSLSDGEERRAGNLQEQIDLILGIRAARRSVAGLDVLYRLGQPLKVTGYCLHSNCWQAFNEYRKLELEELELEKAKKPTEEIKRLKESKRLIQFNTSERFDHMQLARGLAEVIPDPRSWVAGHPSFVNTQTIKEAIAAEEALLNMVSTVLPDTEPLLAIYKERVREKQERYFVRVLHVETVIFASEDELNDLRKTVDHRKQWLSLERAKSLARVSENDVTGRPDKWYFGSTDPTQLKDLTFPGIDPASHLGYVWELAQEWSRLTGGDALDYQLPPAPQIGGWHLRNIQAMSHSFNTLLEMAEQVRNGGAITDKDMREKYLPALVQYEPEVTPGVPSVVWTFWEVSEEGYALKPHAEPGPGRVPHAVPYRDIALWYDWWWTMANDQYVYPRLVEYMNRKFAEAGLPEAVRVTADGPDSNYFRHHDIAWEIWRNQPHNPLIERLKEVWNTEVRKKTIHIRPVYYREVLAGLSGGLLKGLSRPDPEFLAYLRDKTKAELARLRGPTGRVPERDREQEKELTRRLAKLNEWLIEATPLDEFTKFVQRLNRLSDRRVRLWAGFQTHGKSGSLMGFEIGEAKAFVKEGYGTDNGHHLEEQQNWQADLIMMGWLCGQFTKALYLARGLSILISASVNPFERHKAEAAAVQGGLHPDIARHVVEGFKGLDNLLLPLDEPAAAEYVKAIFAAKEIRQLGRDVAKEILERGEFRKEMDAMIIA